MQEQRCPTCKTTVRSVLLQLRVAPYYNPSSQGKRCEECGTLSTYAPTQAQIDDGVQVDPWGQILGFDGQSMRLKNDSIQQHKRDIGRRGVTTLYHQTNVAAAQSIVGSQRFRAGPEGCVGQGMYFAQLPEETYPKTTSTGPILAADVRLGTPFKVSLADSQGRWPRKQTCEDSLAYITEHGCRLCIRA
jgi:hypothetical protein